MNSKYKNEEINKTLLSLFQTCSYFLLWNIQRENITNSVNIYFTVSFLIRSEMTAT